MKSKLNVKGILTLAVTFVMVVLLVTLVLADDVVSDADLVTTTENESTWDFGPVAAGAVLTHEVGFQLNCSGKQHVDDGKSVSIVYNSGSSTIPGGSLVATNTTIGTIPASWPDDSSVQGQTNCGSTSPTPLYDNGNSVVTITAPNSVGSFTYLVKYSYIVSNNDAQAINPNSGTVKFTLSVSAPAKTTPTITLSCPASVTYNGSAQTPCSATVTDDGNLNQALTVTYGNNTNVGTATASASYAGDATHNSNSGSTTFNIAKAPVTATAGSGSTTYNGVTHAPSACVVSGAYTDGLTCTNNPATVGPDAGTTTITPSIAASNNFDVTLVNGSYTIAKAPVTATAGGGSSTYDGATHEPQACLVSGAYTGDLSCTNSPATVGPDAGTMVISPSVSGTGLGNFDVAPVSGSYTINKANATCTINGYTGVYDGAAYGATGSCIGVGGVGLSGLDLGAKFTNVPGGTANWTFAGGTNYNDQNGTASITISKADATCIISGYSGVYDGAAHVATGTCTGVGIEDLSSGLNFGASFTDYPGGTANWAFIGGTNYNDQSGAVEIIIRKADAICNISGYTGTYDGLAHFATGSCIGVGGVGLSGLVLGDNYTNVPGGTANWTFTGGINYNNQSSTAEIVINKADATCTINGYTDVYDGKAHSATGTCTGVDGTDLDGLDLGASFTDFPGGTANWAFTGGTNYDDQSGAVEITISKANAICVVTGYEKVYDGAAHGATGTCTGVNTVDLTSGLAITGSFTNVPGGTATWIFTGGTNYNDQSGIAAIVISKANPICTINGYTGVYDAVGHGATGTCTGVLNETLAGLVLGDSFTNVPGGTASWVFTDTTGNYNDMIGTAAITISKADATCTISGYTGVYDGAAHGATGVCTGIGGAVLNGLNLGSSFTNVPGGTADWSFSNINYNDQFGNATITINAWTLKGFYQPVDMNGVLNTVKNGSTVPLKFEVFAGSTELNQVGAVKSLTAAQITCDLTLAADEIETVATGGTSLRYDVSGGQFIYNWKTPTTAGKCYRVTMTTQDNSTIVAYFKLK